MNMSYYHRSPRQGFSTGENVSKTTRVFCSSCRVWFLVPWGQYDTVHNCTITCPYCQTWMRNIPGDPSKAVVRLLPTTAEQMMTEFRRYFYYCPNPICSFLLANNYGYIQEKVATEIFIGR